MTVANTALTFAAVLTATGPPKVRSIYFIGSRVLFVDLKGGIPLIGGQNETIPEGDSQYIHVTLTEKDGTPLDLTGMRVEWKCGPIRKDTTSGITVTNAVGGKCTINLLPEDSAGLTGSFSHEADVIDAQNRRSTVMRGVIKFK